MSCNAYRSFAIYLLIVILIPESPVSGFTLRRARATTLRSNVQDLAAEGSALLEIKSDLSKLNNERDFEKNSTRKTTLKHSANLVRMGKKFTSGGNKHAVQSTTAKLPNENDDVTKPSENKTIQKDTTTSHLIFGKGERFKPRAEPITKAPIEKNISDSNSAPPISVNVDTGFSTRQANMKGDNKPNDKSPNNDDSDYYSTSTECSESSDTEEAQSTDSGKTDKPGGETTNAATEIFQDATTNAESDKEEIIIYKIIKKSTTPQIDTTKLETESFRLNDVKSTKSNDIESDSTVTDSTALTESMVPEFSSSPSKDPSWKKYTIIERKRTNPTREVENLTTEVTHELEKAESATSRISLENEVGTSTPQFKQDLSDIRTTALDTEDLKLSSTLDAFNNVPETETEKLLSTRPLNAETTTEIKLRDSLASRRGGFLDLSVSQNADEMTTTELFEDIKYNETELLGSMFEAETQDNEGQDLKNSTMVESQSQLADDAIKEELMKEAVLSDHEENSKRYNDDNNKVKPLDASPDDSLSVKPIGKGALYTTRSNYKPMKKIEVQPLKPYVRHPDDNSWRNESLSYLGIVFKAKNASKPFTQVIKNKTEAELNNWTDKDNKNEVPDLRERLEKIAEVRKSKKKKLNQFGEMVYSDYESESSSETSSTQKIDTVSRPIMDFGGEIFFENPNPSKSTSVRIESATPPTSTPGVYMYEEETVTTTKKPKKNKFAEYYDTTDEYDADYLSLSKIDLKKFTTRLLEKEPMTTAPPLMMFTKPMNTMLPDRRPTVQYFPPREPPRRESQKVNINDYDNDFQKKVNMFAYSEPPKSSPVTVPPATMDFKTTQYLRPNSAIAAPALGRQYRPGNLAKNVYVTFPPRVVEQPNGYPPANGDESFNRASYVIKHFKDLIDEAVKDDYDKSAEFVQPYTESPLMGVTIKDKDHKSHMDNDYEYETNIGKDIMNRFVENFNQNSERFKVDFPILYNSSVVHMQEDENGKVVASSSAFLKRQYGAARACCDARVELSPAYELHYYVPEQEERAEAEKPATAPFSYRL